MIEKTRQDLDSKKYSVEELVKSFLKDSSFKENALKQAKEADHLIQKGEASTLTGIPYYVKDNIQVKGKKCSAGSKILENYVSPFSALCVEKLKEKGAILVGKISISEFDNKVLDCPENTPPFSLGGGFFNNIFNFRKPSIPKNGLISLTSSLDQITFFTHTIKDLELLFNMEEYKKDLKIEKHNIPEYTKSCYNILKSAEAFSNLARYDGIRYGLREDGNTLNDIYTNTRTNGFGEEIKKEIVRGAYFLSSENYKTYFKKALKIRILIKQEIKEALKKADVLLLPNSKELINLLNFPSLFIPEIDSFIITEPLSENKLFKAQNILKC